MKQLINKGIYLNSIGIFLLLVGIIAAINTVYKGLYENIFWLCYIGLILMGIGILIRSPLLIIAQLNLLLIPDLIWAVDFFSILFSGNSLLGISDYFFKIHSFSERVISAQHLYAIPLSILALSFIKLQRKDAWKLSIVEAGAFFAMGRIFTSAETNVNCAYKLCMNLEIPGPYALIWLVLTFVMIFLTNFLINIFFRKRANEKY